MTETIKQQQYNYNDYFEENCDKISAYNIRNLLEDCIKQKLNITADWAEFTVGADGAEFCISFGDFNDRNTPTYTIEIKRVDKQQ